MKIKKKILVSLLSIPVFFFLLATIIIYRKISDQNRMHIETVAANQAAFAISYTQLVRALTLFKEICNRYPTNEEGPEVLAFIPIENCPQYKYSVPLLGRDQLGHISKPYQKVRFKIDDKDGAYLNWSGRDLKFNTNDDTYMPISATFRKSSYPDMGSK